MSYDELKSKYVIGRDWYSCVWCAERIEKGEKHLARTYVFNGDFNSDRMHLECEVAMNAAPQWFQHEISDDGFAAGDYRRGTWNQVGDPIDETMRPDIDLPYIDEGGVLHHTLDLTVGDKLLQVIIDRAIDQVKKDYPRNELKGTL